jgi:hypothetical protein
MFEIFAVVLKLHDSSWFFLRPNVCGTRNNAFCCQGWKTLTGGNQCIVRKYPIIHQVSGTPSQFKKKLFTCQILNIYRPSNCYNI